MVSFLKRELVSLVANVHEWVKGTGRSHTFTFVSGAASILGLLLALLLCFVPTSGPSTSISASPFSADAGRTPSLNIPDRQLATNVAGLAEDSLPYVGQAVDTEELPEALNSAQGLTGKWRDLTSFEEVSFHEDGSVIFEAPLKTTRGRYELLPEKRLRLTLPGLFYGTNTLTYSHGFVGDNLHLELENVLLYKLARID